MTWRGHKQKKDEQEEVEVRRWRLGSGRLSDTMHMDALRDTEKRLNTWTALYGRDATTQIVQALEVGFTHIDTAQMYGNEKTVGRGLASFFNSPSAPTREELFITGKFASKSPSQTVKQVLEIQLQDLGLNYLDLYLLHTPVNSVGQLGAIWRQFEEVKKAGLAKEIGISNFRVGDLEELLASDYKELPAVHQIEFHPYVFQYCLPILEIHQKHGIRLASYGGQTPVSRKTDGPVNAVLDNIVEDWKQKGVDGTPNQVLLRWLDAKDAIVVTTSSKRSRLQEMLATSEKPSLTPEQVETIDSAGAQLHFRGYVSYLHSQRA
ncbi:Aldo/keto reductase [Serendipita vermifera]|nr:Aldo/keto reductase [Serendipita vermifera]